MTGTPAGRFSGESNPWQRRRVAKQTEEPLATFKETKK